MASDWNHQGDVIALVLQTEGEGEYPIFIDSDNASLMTHQKNLIEASLSEVDDNNSKKFKILSFNIIKDFNQGD